MRSPVEVNRAVEGVRLGAALPGLQSELRGMEDALFARVFAELEKGKLTPEQALWAWLELHTYRRLERRLRTRAVLGAADLETIQKETENG